MDHEEGMEDTLLYSCILDGSGRFFPSIFVFEQNNKINVLLRMKQKKDSNQLFWKNVIYTPSIWCGKHKTINGNHNELPFIIIYTSCLLTVTLRALNDAKLAAFRTVPPCCCCDDAGGSWLDDCGGAVAVRFDVGSWAAGCRRRISLGLLGSCFFGSIWSDDRNVWAVTVVVAWLALLAAARLWGLWDSEVVKDEPRFGLGVKADNAGCR